MIDLDTIKYGVKIPYLIIGAVGTTVAMFFGKRQTKTLRDYVRSFFTVVSGALITSWLTPLVFIWKPKWEAAEYGIVFAVGLFGMGLIEGVFNIIGKFKENPVGLLESIKKIFTK